jgi:Gas vesicle synthesis protein GvpL/GvpF
MADTPIYLYGLTAAGGPPVREQGLPDGRSAVTAITAGGASALVGRHDGLVMRSLPRPELLRRLTLHQRVIEDALAGGDILPAQFGTVLAAEDEVRFLLTGWGGLVRESLQRFSGLVEAEVAATWDLQQVLAGAASDPEVIAAKAAAAQAPSGEFHALQIRLGEIVKDVLDRRRARCQEMLLTTAGPLAERVQPNVLLSDELVFNVAFLLRRQAIADFEAAIDRLDEEFAGSVRLRLIGPLPPYTFGTVTVTRFDAERLAAGRALLGLAGEISEQAVLSRYRQLAREFHPDLEQPVPQQADGAAAKRFAALGAARADLLAYARAQARASGIDAAGSDPALLVTIGGAGQEESAMAGRP